MAYSGGQGARSTTLHEAAVYALEVTGKDISQVEAAMSVIPPATPINIAFLGNEDHCQRINAARTIRACGFEPVPIISSRRLHSAEDLDILVGSLIHEASPSRFIFVGGDPSTPIGPFPDSLALLGSGVVRRRSALGCRGRPMSESCSVMPSSLEW